MTIYVKGAKIKALLKLKGLQQKDVASALNFTEASFNNKLSKGNFNVAELVKIALIADTKIAFIDVNNNPIFIFESDDIKELNN